MRRGDAPPNRRTTSEEALYAMRKLRVIYGDKLHFHIYTEGPKKDLNLLRRRSALRVTLHISEETKRRGSKEFHVKRQNLEDLIKVYF